MKKAYLFIYDGDVGTRDEVKQILNGMSTISNWRYDIPNCFYVISEKSAQEIYNDFVNFNGTKGRFMFIEESSNRQGQMLPETWYFLSNKSHKPKAQKS